ncbi:hypothetical protein O181_033176 [Austropuccinia psidii MF-1]|uniref:Uncharacterized protein n=1 Tax=Austropuccinia psidii MF-1 TaxID=1389203 RepID=A0A9Q3D3W7_9BASI|nr:hypothetical protein [Austropuccinia psidii MF-1]
MEHGQQDVQPGILLGRTWSKFPEDLKGWNPTRQLTRSRPSQLSSGFTPFRHQKGNDLESQLFTIPGGFQEKKRIQGEKQDLFQPKAERVRPHDTEAVCFGERSAQEPEVAVNHSRISIPTNRNITFTQTEHNIVTSESNIKRDALWLKVLQYSERSAKQFSELEESHGRINKLTAFMDKIVRDLQEGHAQLSKAPEETKKRLNLVFEE